ncbi:hypothetical protein Zm00014a_044681 [Zea mays]|uniref:Uncharacterized protein n=1 Tax=Zea mays TaxID=4577 RepID=A0A3L6EJ07_MAIZE|nr:hypothetical protein Zm00014a_044681 [Zea mays]
MAKNFFCHPHPNSDI